MTSHDFAPTLRVEARFKNARLYNAIAERSICLATDERSKGVHRSGPIKSWCELHGLSYTSVYLLLNLKLSPIAVSGSRRRIRPLCERLAVLLECDVAWLFPSDMYSVKWPRLATEIDHHKMVPLLAAGRTVLSLPPAQHDNLEQDELRTAIGNALTTLTPREEKVIRARYGLGGEDEHTLSDVGQMLGVSQERVRQIESKAMRKLRHPSRLHKFKSAL